MSGLVKLNWDNFSETITASLKTFASEEMLQDVTLVSDDLVEVGAHKLVLCSASPVFREILLKSEGQTRPLLFLRGIKHKTLKAILQFMYEGWTSVPQEEVNDVVNVAVDLEIKNFFNEDTAVGEAVGDHENENVNKQKKKKRGPKKKQEKTKTIKVEQKTESVVLENQHEFKLDAKEEIKRNIICEKCGHISDSIGAAKYHNKSRHRKIIYECEICHKRYSDRSSRNKHRTSVHEGLRYPCPECSYQATQRGSLKEHLQAIHWGIRHQCQQCDQKCYSAGMLKKHIKTKHVGSK